MQSHPHPKNLSACPRETYDWKIVLHFYVDTQFAHALGSYFGTAAPLPTILLEEVLKTAGTFTLHELETSLRPGPGQTWKEAGAATTGLSPKI